MKNILIIMVLVAAGYQAWNRFSPSVTGPEPVHDGPYIVVYGRNSCSFTLQTLKDLEASGVPFEYRIVDDKSVAVSLHARMQDAGMNTRRYNLPVVEVNNNFSIRPRPESIIESYNE